MKISKLYLKIFLGVVAVLVVADIIAFVILISEEMPGHRVHMFTDKMEMARDLVEQELRHTRSRMGSPAESIPPLIRLLAKGNSARVWITGAQDGILFKSFDKSPHLPIPNEDMIPLYDDDGLQLYSCNASGTHSVYLTADIREHGRQQLQLHMFISKRGHREEEWLLHGMVMMTVLSALFLIPVSRTITRPLHQLSEAADRLGRGDFSQRAPEKGKDEVAVLARKFNSMAASLEQMVLSGKELTANLSHELRSPLARMRIALQMALEQGEKGQDNTRFLDKIRNTIESMDVLIGHILELSKLDLREPPPRTDKVNIQALLLSLLDTYSPMVEQKRLKVRTGELMETPRLRCHAPYINIMLDNVLGNAVKYTAPDGKISMKLWSDNALHIEVDNEHPQLSEKDLSDMFIPFHRLDKGKEAGTGLGLATASKIAALHEGAITAAWESGIFQLRIDLPLV